MNFVIKCDLYIESMWCSKTIQRKLEIETEMNEYANITM